MAYTTLAGPRSREPFQPVAWGRPQIPASLRSQDCEQALRSHVALGRDSGSPENTTAGSPGFENLRITKVSSRVRLRVKPSAIIYACPASCRCENYPPTRLGYDCPQSSREADAVISQLQPTRIKDILDRESAGGEVQVQGWVKTRRSSGAVAFIQISDGSTLSDLQVVVEESCPDYPLVESLNTGASISARGSLVPSQGRGQKFEVNAGSLTVLGLADPETYPLAEEAPHPRVPPGDCPPPAPHQHLRRRGPHPQRHRLRHPQLLPGAGFPVHPDPHDHRQRRRGRRSHVPGHHPGPQGPAPTERRGGRHRGLLWTPRLPHRQRPAGGGNLRPGPVQRLHLRPHLPRRELQHIPSPGRVLDGRARGRLLRPGRAGRSRRRLPQSPSSPTSWNTARRIWSFSTAGTTRPPSKP